MGGFFHELRSTKHRTEKYDVPNPENSRLNNSNKPLET